MIHKVSLLPFFDNKHENYHAEPGVGSVAVRRFKFTESLRKV